MEPEARMVTYAEGRPPRAATPTVDGHARSTPTSSTVAASGAGRCPRRVDGAGSRWTARMASGASPRPPTR